MNTFQTRRHFDHAPQAVFAAIQDPQRLARWWGPEGFSNHFQQFDFRIGGSWVFDMVGPDGSRYPNRSVFFSIEENRQVVIDHVCEPFFRLTLTLEPEAEGTLLHWQQVFVDPEVAQAVAHIVEPANEQNLDRLGVELG